MEEIRVRLKYGEVRWVLDNLLTLRAGQWPDPEWYESFGNRVKSFQANFIRPCEAAAEVEVRLYMCGLDGFLVKEVYAWGETYEYLSANLNLSKKEINRGIQATLAYITGKWPKDRNYKTHKNHFWKR